MGIFYDIGTLLGGFFSGCHRYSAVAFPAKTKRRIWIHAPSVGEAKAVIPLIRLMKEEVEPCEIVFSSMTGAAQNEMERSGVVDHTFLLPLDLSWTMKRLIAALAPDHFILVESGFWYHKLEMLKRAKIPITLVSGKISHRSSKRYRFLPRFTKKLFRTFDAIYAQTEEERARFIQLGVDQLKVATLGNLKLDAPLPLHLPTWTPLLDKKIITIACTHEGEEELLLDTLQSLTTVQILLAPRHPRRFAPVSAMLQQRGVDFTLISKGYDPTSRVIIIDQMGLLDACYHHSDLAILGGSFIKGLGGHNIYEPLRHQIPVLYGPHMSKQQQLVDLFKPYPQIARQTTLANLLKESSTLLNDPPPVTLFTQIARQFSGATEKTYKKIKLL